MEPIDTFKKEWPEVVKARWSVLSLVVICVALTFGFATLLNNASLSGKDATIESLKTRTETVEAEKADLEKKLASMSGMEATIESLNSRIATLEADKADLNKKLASASKARTDEGQADALNQVAKDRDELRRQLDSSKKEVDELRVQLNKTTSALPAKSPILGLDDAKRFQIIKALTDAGDSGCMMMQAGLPLSPDGQRTWDTWGEVQQPLFYAGSRFTQISKAFIGPGISITVGAKSGHGYECGRRLKDLLDGLNVRPVSFRIDEAEPDLIACKNECIQVVLGKLDAP